MIDVKNNPAAMAFSARAAELRFPLIVLLVAYHSLLSLGYECNIIEMRLPGFLVVMFLMFSGYFLTWRLENSENISYGNMIWKKVKSLLIPYLLWNLLLFVPHYLLDARAAGGEFPPILSALGDAFGVTARFPVDVPLWFLRNLFLCFLISPLLLKLARIPGMIFVAVPLLFLEYYFWQENPLVGFVMFFTGMIMGLKKYDLRWMDRIFWYTVPLLTAVLFVVYRAWNNGNILSDVIIQVSPAVIGALLMIRAGLILEKNRNGKIKTFLVWCSAASTLIFCAHSPMLSITARILRRFYSDPSAFWMIWILQSVAVILICCIANHLGKKWFPKTMELFTGGRFG